MDKITTISVSFGAPVELTSDEEQALHDTIGRICARYSKEHPERTMWLSGYGSLPLNIWTAGDDEPLVFDNTCLSMDCTERENFDWPCAKCGIKQGDHGHCITNPEAGQCVYEPANKRKGA
ncbi:MAG: hypothetical protein KDK24_10155 [Pseudooceanicola sp.]|nr:hypothetical protein [Pseudooceanicola sp.]